MGGKFSIEGKDTTGKISGEDTLILGDDETVSLPLNEEETKSFYPESSEGKPARPVSENSQRNQSPSSMRGSNASGTATRKSSSIASHSVISAGQNVTQSRRDLLTGEWTIFAPARDARPNEFETTPPESVREGDESGVEVVREAAAGFRDRGSDPISTCPFCTGSESQTPLAVWSGRWLDNPPSHDPTFEIAHGEQPGWNVRVVPNKYPAVSSEATADQDTSPRVLASLNKSSNAFFPNEIVSGGHEVFIESPGHTESLTQGDPADVYLLMAAYRDRIGHYRTVPGIKYISVFKNNGPAAGASLSHSHSQLIATSILPSRIRTMVKRMQAHRAQSGCCLQCDLLRAELADGSRIVSHTGGLVAFCPFASRHPGTIRVTQTKHNAYFEDQSDEELDSLSRMIVRLISWLESSFPGIAYNYYLHSCPPASDHSDAFHWSLDLFPRLTKTAGFEWSSDCIINPMLPETAAATYRRRAADSDPRFVLS